MNKYINNFLHCMMAFDMLFTTFLNKSSIGSVAATQQTLWFFFRREIAKRGRDPMSVAAKTEISNYC